MNLEFFNSHYQPLSARERLEELYKHYPEDKILFTSSFGSTAVILLHMISQIRPQQKINFINTGYHFEKTLEYKKLLTDRFNLDVVDLGATSNRHKFTSDNLTYSHNQNLCCFINKVDPVERVKRNYHIWISGLLQFQNVNRANLPLFVKTNDIVKFHPLLDMTEEETALYIELYDLPIHPLVEEGYDSIGCTHCTSMGTGRTGRWMNSSKTECGLHV
ncbi:MAG: phosphoadenylyl-sulfate reductase [Bacteroidetes bacterium]|nr:phosphoadenylyl-sulfate reductase [Bacteroidota bacterium]MDA1121173.1 phosphoadenylyl-sulfate reductase [Bacteroidota bacterium]